MGVGIVTLVQPKAYRPTQGKPVVRIGVPIGQGRRQRLFDTAQVEKRERMVVAGREHIHPFEPSGRSREIIAIQVQFSDVESLHVLGVGMRAVGQPEHVFQHLRLEGKSRCILTQLTQPSGNTFYEKHMTQRYCEIQQRLLGRQAAGFAFSPFEGRSPGGTGTFAIVQGLHQLLPQSAMVRKVLYQRF